MHLSEAMRIELERRLSRIEREQPEDPAFRELPTADLVVLLALAVCAIVATVWLQAR